MSRAVSSSIAMTAGLWKRMAVSQERELLMETEPYYYYQEEEMETDPPSGCTGDRVGTRNVLSIPTKALRGKFIFLQSRQRKAGFTMSLVISVKVPVGKCAPRPPPQTQSQQATAPEPATLSAKNQTGPRSPFAPKVGDPCWGRVEVQAVHMLVCIAAVASAVPALWGEGRLQCPGIRA
ncbi:unnamed protein product [Caretta caretta]